MHLGSAGNVKAFALQNKKKNPNVGLIAKKQLKPYKPVEQNRMNFIQDFTEP